MWGVSQGDADKKGFRCWMCGRFDKLKETALEFAFLLKTHGLAETEGAV